jgi:hypothetical protein
VIDLTFGDGEFAQRPGLTVVRQEVRGPYRPTAARHPVALREVLLVERAAPPTPALRAAPERAHAASVEREVVTSDIAPAIERLGRAPRLERAALEKHDAEGVPARARVLERARDRDAGRACTDDADITLDDCTVRD